MPRYPLAFIGLLLLNGAWTWQQDPSLPVPESVDERPQAPLLLGFSAQASADQLISEGILAGALSPRAARLHHRVLTEEPHVAGQPAQRRVAEYVLDEFRKAGLEAEIVEYQAYIPYPASISVRLVEPEEREFEIREKGYRVDKDTFSKDVIAPYNAYSPSGKVDAQVIYVNYGLEDDYQRLAELGIDVKGKIVLARYGRSFRGVKVRLAENRGAAGVLLYSDPIDDGYFRGDVFPDGPMRPPSAVQRGSIEYIFLYPGDPLTPAIPATPEAQRIEPAQAINLPRIPCQPLSYEQASEILRNLRGPNVPTGWQGGLSFAYHVGPGPARVKLDLKMDFALRPVLNVIGRIPGSVYPDEWVIAGNHIDAWTYGGVDPNSGTTSLIQMAQGLGRLLQQGRRPQRTLILAGWGGEEFGMIGSTEWGEQHRDELVRKAVAYINVDAAVSGRNFSAGAVPALKSMLRQATRAVRDPWSGETVYDNWLRSRGTASDGSGRPPQADDLGGGSDYAVFLDHLGVPSMSMSFGGPYGVYHSIYDTHYWMNRFGDPAWQYHTVMSELWGRVVLRLASAEVLPLDYAAYGSEIDGHLEKLEARAAAAPGTRDQGLDWNSLRSEARSMQRIGEDINSGVAELLSRPVDRSQLDRINELLKQAERGFILEAGLPGRPWYRHAIYAPGIDTGYASLPLPGLAEALEKGNPLERRQQAAQLLDKLRKVNRALDQVRRLTQ